MAVSTVLFLFFQTGNQGELFRFKLIRRFGTNRSASSLNRLSLHSSHYCPRSLALGNCLRSHFWEKVACLHFLRILVIDLAITHCYSF
ncbi:hypothetical protein GJ744_008661 [Endocarpon pusillum]|uniref:Uncharacterized protein n=1 Tax=Endocarpon pusillum TaxID=364733 RepID=A0A8H7AIJ0_9EURO|nr:hypothetical protein GJ744_008661 [Endocarpon pusillum]